MVDKDCDNDGSGGGDDGGDGKSSETGPSEHTTFRSGTLNN